MTNEREVSEHYRHGDLLTAIEIGLAGLQRSRDTVTVDDLAAIDEFHIGGRTASESFLEQLALSGQDHVLDIGCGLGGAARFVASRFRSRVTGIDLSEEYITTGNRLCEWVGLDGQIELQHGSVLSMPFTNASFSAGYMMHVGMNIEDKTGLFAEVGRVLRDGAVLGVYDVMRTADGELNYPVPWAASTGTSCVASPAQYKACLEEAGFELVTERDRREFALEFFSELQARAASRHGPPPLGIHILMGRTAPDKVSNMIANVSAGLIAPVELVARKV